jgi:hypothetical protein
VEEGREVVAQVRVALVVEDPVVEDLVVVPAAVLPAVAAAGAEGRLLRSRFKERLTEICPPVRSCPYPIQLHR